MNNQQRLFLIQARSDYQVFAILTEKWKKSNLPACHALHYLQMATEKLAKARFWKHGRTGMTHRVFKSFFETLPSDPRAQKAAGYGGKNEQWKAIIRASTQFAEAIQELVPRQENQGPNPEYPWPPDEPVTAPVEFKFRIWHDLQESAKGRKFLKLVERLFAGAEAFLD